MEIRRLILGLMGIFINSVRYSIRYVCNALRYKPAFIATPYSGALSPWRSGFDLLPGK